MSKIIILTMVLACSSIESRQQKLQRACPERFKCGLNATYMLLKLAGREVRYSDLLENARVDSQGASLLEVKDELRRFGLAAEVIKCQPSDLRLVDTPYIIYTHADTPGDLGHFDVVVSTGDKSLEVLDTNTGLEKTYSLERIATNLQNGRYFKDDIFLIVYPRERHFILEVVLTIASLTLICFLYISKPPSTE